MVNFESKHFSQLTIKGLPHLQRSLLADPADVGKIALIGQLSVRPDRRIHLCSNERRCSKTKNEWLISQALPDNVFVPPEGCNSIKARTLEEDAELRITPGEFDRDLRSILRAIGKWANKRFDRRVHFEIVVSGARVFLVQVDSEEARGGVDPRKLPLEFRGFRCRKYIGTTSHSRPSSRSWRMSQTFQTTEYDPPHRLFYATAAEIAAALEGGRETELCAEIDRVTGGRLVIREDLSSASGPGFNLHRTDTIDPKEAIRTLKDRIQYWLSQGEDTKQVCFIIHGFIPARASACGMYSHTEKRIASTRSGDSPMAFNI